MLLTDILLLDYKRCQRRAFLNVYGDSLEKDAERDFVLKLRQENQLHIASTLKKFYPHHQKPQYNLKNWKDRAKDTEVLMKQGVSCIYNGTLFESNEFREQCAPRITPTLFSEHNEFDCLGKPTLLVKQAGKSKFGDWFYTPVSINLGRRPKPEYKIVATFYAYLLGNLQEITPPTPTLILRQHNHYEVDLSQWLSKFQITATDCLEMLTQSQEPEVFISRQRCNLCHWYNHCYTIAQSQQHLSLVPGVTPSRYQSLLEVGVGTVKSLANICPVNMREVMDAELANQLQQQAQAIVDNRAIRKSQFQEDIHRLIPTRKFELYFDIEAEPERNLDYLLGVLLVERSTKTEIFYPLLAESPEDEQQIWQEFLYLANQYQDAPIFHFSGYEVETMKRLAKLYKTPQQQLERLLSRFVDIHYHVITSVILPVENYSLKSLANWIGFNWRDPGISGDQCVCWYDQWLKTEDHSLLSSILRYNEDDCRATLYLKNWLLEFLG
ncbi:TM0106 family RecB-like putative nuclease [Cyanobacterium sp. uoEpiScrs1]|uniref:TM0106 family RecB-like putative nuclease n=1 Tax=Cyanobacterium sp. uoEpiScrs1 TaxID=2976343 RepID=UPI00226AE989|nr:TM0106 family RecB-like putative nuclease [Cyanobacterium sp. uoEpiScrs1]